MDQNQEDVAIVLRTLPNRDEAELLAYLQSLLERREAALAQPLVQDEQALAWQDANRPAGAAPYRH